MAKMCVVKICTLGFKQIVNYQCEHNEVGYTVACVFFSGAQQTGRE